MPNETGVGNVMAPFDDLSSGVDASGRCGAPQATDATRKGSRTRVLAAREFRSSPVSRRVSVGLMRVT
jgi:hypothetical protein